ncbi:hypothetical protein DL770_000170 [Monosporascus sp. CRB-9-2]|nr:hypothetical protein DL770_000170 [Monosporascus sp. CRB-9-2]
MRCCPQMRTRGSPRLETRILRRFRCCPLNGLQPRSAPEEHLTVGACLRIKSLRGDGVDLVGKDNGGAVLAGHPEDVTYHSRSLAQILLHNSDPTTRMKLAVVELARQNSRAIIFRDDTKV